MSKTKIIIFASTFMVIGVCVLFQNLLFADGRDGDRVDDASETVLPPGCESIPTDLYQSYVKGISKQSPGTAVPFEEEDSLAATVISFGVDEELLRKAADAEKKILTEVATYYESGDMSGVEWSVDHFQVIQIYRTLEEVEDRIRFVENNAPAKVLFGDETEKRIDAIRAAIVLFGQDEVWPSTDEVDQYIADIAVENMDVKSAAILLAEKHSYEKLRSHIASEIKAGNILLHEHIKEGVLSEISE